MISAECLRATTPKRKYSNIERISSKIVEVQTKRKGVSSDRSFDKHAVGANVRKTTHFPHIHSELFNLCPDCINIGIVSHCLYSRPSVRACQQLSGVAGDWFQIAPVISANNWGPRRRAPTSQPEPKLDRGPQLAG